MRLAYASWAGLGALLIGLGPTQLAPSQIRPGTNGFVLTTVSGATTWAAISATGAASGDLSGSYPSPTVSKLQGSAVSSTAPSANQVLTYSGTSWTPTSWSTGLPSAATAGRLLYDSGSSWSAAATNAIFWDATNLRLGIGSNSPASPLTIGFTPGASAAAAIQALPSTTTSPSSGVTGLGGIQAGGTFNYVGSANTWQNGATFTTNFNNTCATNDNRGLYVQTTGNSSTATGLITGALIWDVLGSASKATTIRDLYLGGSYGSSSQVVSNRYGIYVDNPAVGSGATVSTNTGIYVAPQTAGSTNYSIYSAGGSNFFAGSVQAGSLMSSDGSAGISTTITYLRPGGSTGILVFKNGLLTSSS